MECADWCKFGSFGGKDAMRKLNQILGNIKMTTAIATLVIIAIIGSIAAVSGAICCIA